MIKKYKALRAIAFAGMSFKAGQEVEMEEAEAINIGIGDYLQEISMSDEEVKAPEAVEANDAVKDPEAAAPVLKKYKVVTEFKADAVEASEGVEAKPEVNFEVGQEVEMEESHAAPLVAEGILELVAE